MDSIIFATRNNNNFYKLELAKTLLHFIEYDFTYFWEQCIELGKTSRVKGGVSSKQFAILKNLIVKSHPYYEAQINSDFEHIALDCIIEYICHSENIGLEELWTRCISPKNLYEKSLFTRISEYKINRAINQWANLMRTQEYARIKLAYIFDGEPATEIVYKARKAYFDLTFSVAAKELGFPEGELPAVKRYNPSLIPNAPFMISKVSKGILRRISEIVDNAQEPDYHHVTACMRDQIGLDAFSYIKNLPRPDELLINAASESFSALAEEVYVPDSFKSILDLEFDKMIEKHLFMQKCESCEKYFPQDTAYKGRLCNRVNTTGLTCREQWEKEKAAEDPIPQPLLERSQQISGRLGKRVGEEFRENEFREWEQYLTNMLENIRNEYSSLEDLEGFLDYSEKMYGEVMQRPASRPAAVQSNPNPVHIPKTDAPRPEPQKYRFPTLAELESREAEDRFRP